MDAEVPTSLPDEHAYPFVRQIPPDIIKIGPVLGGLKRHCQKPTVRLWTRSPWPTALLIVAMRLGHEGAVFSPGRLKQAPVEPLWLSLGFAVHRLRRGSLIEMAVTCAGIAGKGGVSDRFVSRS